MSSGTVSLEADDAFGTAPLLISGGTVDLSGYSLANSSLTLAGGALQNSNLSSEVVFDNTVTFNGGVNSTIQGTGTIVFNGTLNLTTGSSGLTKSGSGVLRLSGPINQSQNLFISQGTLEVGNNTTNQTIQTLSTGGGTFKKVGSNTVNLRATSGYTGPTVIEEGTLQLGRTTGTTATTNVTMTMASLSGPGTLEKVGNHILTLSGNLSGLTGNLTLSGGTFLVNPSSNYTISANMSGAANFQKDGTAILTLAGNNVSRTGATVINGGTVIFAADNALGSGGTVQIRSDSILDLKGYSLSNPLWFNYGGGTVQNSNTQQTSNLSAYLSVNGGQSATLTGLLNITNAVPNSVNSTLSIGPGVSLNNQTNIYNSGSVNITRATNQPVNALGLVNIYSGGQLTVEVTKDPAHTNQAIPVSGLTVNTGGSIILYPSINSTTNDEELLSITNSLSVAQPDAQTFIRIVPQGTPTEHMTTIKILKLSSTLNTQQNQDSIINLLEVTTPYELDQAYFNAQGILSCDIVYPPIPDLFGEPDIVFTSGAIIDIAGKNLTNNSITLSGATLQNSGAPASFSGSLIINGTGTLTGSSSIELSGPVVHTQGGATLTKSGSGTLSLLGAINQLTSKIDLTDGILIIESGTGQQKILSAPLFSSTGNGLFKKTGSGQLTLSSASNENYTADSEVEEGTLTFAVDDALGSGALTMSGGSVDLAGHSAANSDVSLSGGSLQNSDTNDAAGLSGSVTILENTTISGAGELEISGAFTHTTSGKTLTKSGSGSLILSGTLDSTSDITISSGSIVVGNSTTDQSLGSDLSGSGSLSKTGSNTVTLVGDLGAYSGAISISAGELKFDTSSSYTLSSNLSGAGAFSKAGSGTITLTGSNTYSGDATVSAGGIVFGIDDALSNGALTISGGSVDLAGHSAANNDVSLSGGSLQNSDTNDAAGLSGSVTILENTTISGAGELEISGAFTHTTSGKTLTKSGSGSLILSGTLDSTSDITISSGSIVVGNSTTDQSLGSDLSGSGSLSKIGSNTVSLGGELGSYSGAISISSGTLRFDTSSSYTLSTNLSGAGAFSKAGSGTITLTGSNTYGGDSTVSAGGIVFGIDDALSNGALTISGGSVDLAGHSAANSDVSLSGGSLQNSDTNDAAGLSGSVTILENTTISGAGELEISGAFTHTTSGKTLTKSGSGSLILSGTLDSTSDITISSGSIVVGNSTTDQSLGSDLSGSGALSKTGSNTVTLGGDLGAYSGAISISAGELKFDTSSSYTLNSNLSGAGAFSKAGSGTITLTGSNTYGGDSTVSAGGIVFGIDDALSNGALTISGGSVDLAGHSAANSEVSLSGGSLQNSDTDNSVAVSVGVTVLDDSNIGGSGDLTLSGTLTHTTGGKTLTKDGAGTLTLEADLANTTSAVNIAAGTLALDHSTNQTLTAVVSGPGSLDKLGTNTLTLQADLGAYSGAITMINGEISFDTNSSYTLASNISGGGDLSKSGSGTITLTGSNTYTGDSAVSAGSIVFGVNNALSLGAVTVTGGSIDLAGYSAGNTEVTLNGGTLLNSNTNNASALSGDLTILDNTTLASAGDFTVSGTLTHTTADKTLTKDGAGKVTFAGAMNSTSDIAMTDGTLALGRDGAAQTLASVLTGSAELEKVGDNTVTLTATMAGYDGPITLTEGTLKFQSAASFNIDSTISGPGGIAKDGSGTITFNATNTYSGPTEIINGAVFFGADNALGVGTLTLAGGAFDQAGYALGNTNLALSGTFAATLNAQNTDLISNMETITLADNATLTVTTAGNQTLRNLSALSENATLEIGGSSDGITLLASQAPQNFAGAITSPSNTNAGITLGAAATASQVISGSLEGFNGNLSSLPLANHILQVQSPITLGPRTDNTYTAAADGGLKFVRPATTNITAAINNNFTIDTALVDFDGVDITYLPTAVGSTKTISGTGGLRVAGAAGLTFNTDFGNRIINNSAQGLAVAAGPLIKSGYGILVLQEALSTAYAQTAPAIEVNAGRLKVVGPAVAGSAGDPTATNADIVIAAQSTVDIDLADTNQTLARIISGGGSLNTLSTGSTEQKNLTLSATARLLNQADLTIGRFVHLKIDSDQVLWQPGPSAKIVIKEDGALTLGGTITPSGTKFNPYFEAGAGTIATQAGADTTIAVSPAHTFLSIGNSTDSLEIAAGQGLHLALGAGKKAQIEYQLLAGDEDATLVLTTAGLLQLDGSVLSGFTGVLSNAPSAPGQLWLKDISVATDNPGTRFNFGHSSATTTFETTAGNALTLGANNTLQTSAGSVAKIGAGRLTFDTTPGMGNWSGDLAIKEGDVALHNVTRGEAHVTHVHNGGRLVVWRDTGATSPAAMTLGALTLDSGAVLLVTDRDWADNGAGTAATASHLSQVVVKELTAHAGAEIVFAIDPGAGIAPSAGLTFTGSMLQLDEDLSLGADNITAPLYIRLAPINSSDYTSGHVYSLMSFANEQSALGVASKIKLRPTLQGLQNAEGGFSVSNSSSKSGQLYLGEDEGSGDFTHLILQINPEGVGFAPALRATAQSHYPVSYPAGTYTISALIDSLMGQAVPQYSALDGLLVALLSHDRQRDYHMSLLAPTNSLQSPQGAWLLQSSLSAGFTAVSQAQRWVQLLPENSPYLAQVGAVLEQHQNWQSETQVRNRGPISFWEGNITGVSFNDAQAAHHLATQVVGVAWRLSPHAAIGYQHSSSKHDYHSLDKSIQGAQESTTGQAFASLSSGAFSVETLSSATLSEQAQKRHINVDVDTALVDRWVATSTSKTAEVGTSVALSYRQALAQGVGMEFGVTTQAQYSYTPFFEEQGADNLSLVFESQHQGYVLASPTLALDSHWLSNKGWVASRFTLSYQQVLSQSNHVSYGFKGLEARYQSQVEQADAVSGVVAGVQGCLATAHGLSLQLHYQTLLGHNHQGSVSISYEF